MKIKHVLGCLSLSFVALTTNSLAATLPDVVQQTLTTNPNVLISTHNQRAVEHERRRAIGGYLPSIDLNLGYGRENSENVTTKARYADGDVSLTRHEASLTLSQMLFDGFSTSAKVANASQRSNAAAHRVFNTSSQIALRTVEVYLEHLRREALLDLAKNNLVIHQKMLARIHDVFSSGAGRKADVQQSEARLALAKATLINAQGNLRDAKINYETITSLKPENLVKVDATSIAKYLPSDFNAAFIVMQEKHPALAAAKSDLAAAEAEYRQSRAAYFPTLSLELGASRNENLDGVEGDNDDMSAMLQLSYNLYRGGADVARQRETAARVSAAKEVVRRVRLDAERQLHLAWNSLQTIRERLKYLQQHVKATENVLVSYREQFKLGQRSLLDVLNSENELFTARSSLVVGQYVELLGIYQVLQSSGILLSSLNVTPPSESTARY